MHKSISENCRRTQLKQKFLNMRNTQIGARNKHKYEAEHEVITPTKWL